jgi:hypothetical protein
MESAEFIKKFSEMTWEEIINMYRDCKNENILIFTPFVTHFKRMKYVQIINLYKECKKNSEPQTFDYEKVYLKIVKFYMEKKDYTKEQANEIATIKTNEQQLIWKNKN